MVCGVHSCIKLNRKNQNEKPIQLLSSEPRESVAEMQRNGSKKKCRFMQIKTLIDLIFLAGKFPVLEKKGESKKNMSKHYVGGLMSENSNYCYLTGIRKLSLALYQELISMVMLKILQSLVLVSQIAQFKSFAARPNE